MRIQRGHRLVDACRRAPLSYRLNSRTAIPVRSAPWYSSIRQKHDTSFPPASRFSLRQSRFARFTEPTGEIPSVRNPLNYVDLERRNFRVKQDAKRRMLFCGIGIALTLAFQLWLVVTFYDPSNGNKEKNDAITAIAKGSKNLERLDSGPNSAAMQEAARQGVTVVQKPGQPEIKVDENGLELIDTGTSSVPYFPRYIKVPTASADPSAMPISDMPGQGMQENLEEYSLLGLGIRTVSFLGVQVYVLGLYVRTTDLDKLQAAFVRHVNPLGSSLIPSEKESLKQSLMQDESSLEIWNKVLQEVKVRSAVRIVPTRGTDFGHLRDGWVRGITSRTQELAKKGDKEYDDEAFGKAMQEFKSLMGGNGKAPKGSTLLLARDERGSLQLLYEPEKKTDKGELVVSRVTSQPLGNMEDERISRQVWLGYLGGKNVSSPGAKKNIVDGVMDLVARPVGTVGTQVS